MSEPKHSNIPEFQKAIISANKVLADLPDMMPTVKVDFAPILSANDALLKSIQQTQVQLVKTLVLPKIDFPRIDSLLAPFYREISSLDEGKRREAGQKVNEAKQRYIDIVEAYEEFSGPTAGPIDITAPFDVNIPAEKRPGLLPAEQGTRHPLTTEIAKVLDIFYRMGFTAVESREIDDDYHMFTSLNFPPDHPARDEYDTFVTVQKDKDGKPFVAPAHTSIMQNRILEQGKTTLKAGKAIAAVIPGRVFRNEDLDARHEHTFYQLEGIYVDKGVNAGNLLATFKAFLSEYFQQDIEIASQPFYFPFTEPSFELSLSCPFCRKEGCNICSQTGWIELLGMGMIHPNVLKAGGIDPKEHTGFAWGCGIDRLVMMKYGIEDVRHFESAKLDFLRQFP
ncbi:MAG TPA: phenylalanine--tRNA ligase subunit alpha [Candidatus Saccharimonadales bacterium]|nr:phenylalanine--tRNA ligase subunit alpha [Candidatus Saccharimonadales bacterium]